MAGLTDNNQPKAAEEEMVRTMTTTGEDDNDGKEDYNKDVGGY